MGVQQARGPQVLGRCLSRHWWRVAGAVWGACQLCRGGRGRRDGSELLPGAPREQGVRGGGSYPVQLSSGRTFPLAPRLQRGDARQMLACGWGKAARWAPHSAPQCTCQTNSHTQQPVGGGARRPRSAGDEHVTSQSLPAPTRRPQPQADPRQAGWPRQPGFTPRSAAPRGPGSPAEEHSCPQQERACEKRPRGGPSRWPPPRGPPREVQWVRWAGGGMERFGTVRKRLPAPGTGHGPAVCLTLALTRQTRVRGAVDAGRQVEAPIWKPGVAAAGPFGRLWREHAGWRSMPTRTRCHTPRGQTQVSLGLAGHLRAGRELKNRDKCLVLTSRPPGHMPACPASGTYRGNLTGHRGGGQGLGHGSLRPFAHVLSIAWGHQDLRQEQGWRL